MLELSSTFGQSEVLKKRGARVYDRYQNDDQPTERQPIEADIVVTTLNSLHQIKHWEGFDPSKTILILDEIRTILDSSVSETIKQEESLRRFEELVKDARYTILADADWNVDDTCPVFVETILGDAGRYAIMHYPR